MKRFVHHSAIVLVALVLALSFGGCRRQETPEEAAARSAQEAATQLAAQQAARHEITDQMVCRFIEARRDEMAVIPALGNFGLLIGTDWSSLPAGPTKTLQEMEEDCQSVFEWQMKEYREKGRKELEQRIAEEVEAEYTLFKKGDEINLTLHNGVGPSAVVSGKLSEVGRDRVLIGRRWVVKQDLALEEQVRFFPEVRAEFVKRRISERVQTEAGAVVDDIDKAREKSLKEAWLAAGYVPDIRALAERGVKLDAKCWMTKVALLKRIGDYLRSPAGMQYDEELEAYGEGDAE